MVGLTLVEWEPPPLDPAIELGEFEMSGRQAEAVESVAA
jgi:hypothetical protein